MRKNSSARFDSDTSRHAVKASRAVVTAASTSCAVANSTAPVCSPVAGL